MVVIERLDQDGIRDLSLRTDKLGVVSVYVNADPRQDTHRQALAIDLMGNEPPSDIRVLAQ